MNTTNQNNLFPVFLKLTGKNVLIVGGGKIALEKVQTLIKNSPGVWIYLVSPEVKREIQDVADQYGTLFIRTEKFAEEHLHGIDLVITATGIEPLAREIKQRAAMRHIWVNTADVPHLCDFYLGSVVMRGSLKMAISTNGKSPMLARRLREVIDETLPDELELSIEQLHELRGFLQGDFKKRVDELNRITATLLEQHHTKNRFFTLKSRLQRYIPVMRTIKRLRATKQVLKTAA